MTDTPKPTPTPKDSAPAADDAASSSTDLVRVRLASAGGFVRAKVKAVGAWSAGRPGQTRGSSSQRKKPDGN